MIKTSPRPELFLNTVQRPDLPLPLQELTRQIALNHIHDFEAPTGRYYSEETWAEVTHIAAHKWQQKLDQILCEGSMGESAQNQWQGIVRDYYTHDFWQLPTLDVKPKKTTLPLTRDQKIFREMFSYVWVLIQAALIMKIVVFYFGLRSSKEEDGVGTILLIVALLFSAGSLGFFAYRKYRKTKDN